MFRLSPAAAAVNPFTKKPTSATRSHLCVRRAKVQRGWKLENMEESLKNGITWDEATKTNVEVKILEF